MEDTTLAKITIKIGTNNGWIYISYIFPVIDMTVIIAMVILATPSLACTIRKTVILLFLCSRNKLSLKLAIPYNAVNFVPLSIKVPLINL